MILPRWTPEEDAVLREKWLSDTAKAIGALINRPADGVKRRARKLGLPLNKSGRPSGIHTSRRKNIHAADESAIERDPFVAILFGTCEAIKATALPSRIYRQSMEIEDELEAA